MSIICGLPKRFHEVEIIIHNLKFFLVCCLIVVLFKFAKQRQYIFKEFKANWLAAKGDIPVKKNQPLTHLRNKNQEKRQIRRTKLQKYHPKYQIYLRLDCPGHNCPIFKTETSLSLSNPVLRAVSKTLEPPKKPKKRKRET